MKTKLSANHAMKYATMFSLSSLLSIYVIGIIFIISVQSIIFKKKQSKVHATNHEKSYLTVYVFMIGSIRDKFMAYVTETSTGAMPWKLLL